MTKHRLYYLIEKGVIQITRDKATGLYLFPDSPRTIENIRRLNADKIDRVSR